MSFCRLRSRVPGKSGLTRVEILVLVVVILVLAYALLAVRGYFELRSVSHALASAKTLNTLLAQYATDNDNVYPVGEGTRAEGKSEGIALNLLQNQFTPNADIFAVGATPHYSGASQDYADLGPQNISWDFTAGENASTGIPTDAPNWLPIFYTTGETVDYTKAGTSDYNVTPSGNGPFGSDGIVAAYKGGDVRYMPAKPGGPAVPLAFFSLASGEKNTGTYTQIKP